MVWQRGMLAPSAYHLCFALAGCDLPCSETTEITNRPRKYRCPKKDASLNGYMKIDNMFVFLPVLSMKGHRHVFSKKAICLSVRTIFHSDPKVRMCCTVFYQILTISHILKYWVALRCQDSYRLLRNIWQWAAFIENHLKKTCPNATR